VCAGAHAVGVNTFGRWTCGRDKERTTLRVMVFCVGDDPPGISRERGLYSMLHKHSQRSTGESTSQSVPGLKAKASPPPTNTMISHTHTHMDVGMRASYTYAQRHIGECFHLHTHTHTHTHSTHTCTGLASFSFTHTIVLSALPLFIHGDPSADTISFYLNYISQLPILLSKNCFSSCLTLALVPSVSLLQPVSRVIE